MKLGGSLELHSALGAVAILWPITWILQVVPLFFVDGYANRRSWQHARARGEGYAAFIDRRVHRLIAPTAVFLAAATGRFVVEAATGTDILGAGVAPCCYHRGSWPSTSSSRSLR